MNLNRLAAESGCGYLMDPNDESFVGDKLVLLAEKVTAAERERCALLCEAHSGLRSTGNWVCLTAMADRIRDT